MSYTMAIASCMVPGLAHENHHVVSLSLALGTTITVNPLRGGYTLLLHLVDRDVVVSKSVNCIATCIKFRFCNNTH